MDVTILYVSYIYLVIIHIPFHPRHSRMSNENDDQSLPYIPEEDLKSESQTQSGFIKEIKSKRIPGTSEMADLAFNEYTDRNGDLSPNDIKNNFNDLLKELISIETEIYNNKEEEVVRNLMQDFIEEYYSQNDIEEYENTQKLLDQIKTLYEDSDDFESFFSESYFRLNPLIGPIYYSFSQGRKTRVGDSLENHVEKLLTEMNYPVDSQIQLDGSRIDLVLPNEETFYNDPSDAVFLPCQTTLKDRYRLSLSKLPSGEKYEPVSKFITTATGINLVTDEDENDITQDKIEDTVSHGYRFLAFDAVKERFPDNEGIVSYTEFAEEILPKEADSWNVVEQDSISNY